MYQNLLAGIPSESAWLRMGIYLLSKFPIDSRNRLSSTSLVQDLYASKGISKACYDGYISGHMLIQNSIGCMSLLQMSETLNTRVLSLRIYGSLFLRENSVTNFNNNSTSALSACDLLGLEYPRHCKNLFPILTEFL